MKWKNKMCEVIHLIYAVYKYILMWIIIQIMQRKWKDALGI